MLCLRAAVWTTLFLSLSARKTAGSVCDGWAQFNNSCYKLFNVPLSWPAARIDCLSLGADLTSISSIEENDFLAQLSGRDVWIGLNGFVPVKKGDPVWSDSTPISFLSWLHDEPYLSSITVLQVASENRGSWKSVSCFNSSFPYVCKKAYRCSDLQAPKNGFVFLSNITVGAKAEFSCDESYTLIGDTTLTCQSNSLWSASPPTCSQRKNIFILRDEVGFETPENFTSETAIGVAQDLVNLTREQNLTSDELQAGTDILDTLVTLQEDALEAGRNVTTSDDYVNAFIDASSILVDSTNQDSWLATNASDGAPLFLKTMERFGRVTAFTKNIANSNSSEYSSDNIVMTVSTVTPYTVRDISFPDNRLFAYDGSSETSHGVISLPSTLFLTAFNNEEGSKVLMSFLLLRNLRNYMPPSGLSLDPKKTVAAQRNNAVDIPRAVIVSASLVVTSAGVSYDRTYTSQPLSEAIYINYTFQPGVVNSEPACAFWQFANNSTPGQWSSAGLTTSKPTDNTVVCASRHLTSFSVLVAVEEPSENTALSYITYIGCGVSLMCLIMTLICLVYFRAYLQSERNFININFVIALMLALIAFLAGIDRSSNHRLCKAVTIVMQYLFLSVFCWMLCEGILLYRFVVVVFDTGRRHTMKYFTLGWGVPVVIVAVSVALRSDEYGTYSYCFLTHHKGLIYAFIGPMSAILLVNLIVFVIVLKTVMSRKVASQNSRSKPSVIRSWLRATAVLLPVLGLTWAVGVFAVDSLSLPLTYAFTVLNSLQGVFVFLFHCLLNGQVKRAVDLKKQRRFHIKSFEKGPVSPPATYNSNSTFTGGSGKTCQPSGCDVLQSTSSDVAPLNKRSGESLKLDSYDDLLTNPHVSDKEVASTEDAA